MSAKRARLDRFISQKCQIPRKQVRVILARGRVSVDGLVVRDADYQIDQFSHVMLDGQSLRQELPIYLMLHKPVGVVSATKDSEHKTVMDLLPEYQDKGLHIVGRLDLNTSGLVLLTNDSRWSKRIMSPENKVAKQYLVTLKAPLTQAYVKAFAEGFYFAYENITTQPAHLEILDSHLARVTLHEGRYHQIKRMFGRFRNQVMALHRLSVGEIRLDDTLPVGEHRALSADEVATISTTA
ncbi:16S rRNA pseudouridine(516) synthase [Shewanella insulae]|uniref:pseudouridine synthase n=1 Tax=Shewanella insulae TaxID=2681496 RepID=UPI001EFC7586|nr:pseudouridine synthase [Shewanella insulae]MCG9711490.1 16S rRNA pseudouridine(516) synthase [Shewanella insulae]MCG9753916.1 16S rRNA pseudouridine(516) synthase [Shewanella insulae]